MASSENLSIHKSTSNDFTTLASQVTGSHPYDVFESDNIINTNTHTGTDLPGKTLPTLNTQRKPSLSDFAEQIRQLEIEGNKLRTATVASLGYLNGFSSFEVNDLEMPKFQSSNLGNLSALTDISADQKYISDLRMQLEKQSQETERLQKQLLGDMSIIHSSSTVSQYTDGQNAGSSLGRSVNNGGNCDYSHYSHGPEKPALSGLHSSEYQTFGHRLYNFEPPTHLEKTLKESQEQVMSLRTKLQEVTESSELQKKQLYRTIEDLKSKLHDTILNRDTVLDLRQKESNSQEILINKLRSSLTQLQDKYRLQEEVLASTTKKFESYIQECHMTETAFSQIRSILMGRENIHGHPYFETDPVSGQSVAILAHTLEKCLLELDHEINMKSCRISELESDINEVKMNSAERERAVVKEYQQMMKKEADDIANKISHIHAEHEQTEANVTEAAAIARQQVISLQDKIQENETINQHKLRAKELEIKDLEDKIDELKTDNMKARALWQEKNQALESSLDQVQRELIETKAEKKELIHSEAVLKSELEDLQSLTSRYESDLETERDRIQQQRKREEDLRSQVMALEIQITNKQGDIDRLEKMVEVVKQECSATMFDKVASFEKLEKDRYLDQIKHLSIQLADMTERCTKMTVEQQLARSEMDNLRLQVLDLTGKAEKARSQVEFALAEKHDLAVLHGNLDGLQRDKDHYKKMAEQRADEITELKISLDRLKTQLDEKQKILTTFGQQSSSISQLMEVNAKASDSIREERDKLTLALAEKSSQVENLKASHDSLAMKIMDREKRIKDLEDESHKMTDELIVKNQELELLQQEKENIYTELKESRMEVANLVTGRDLLKKEVVRIRTLRSKDISKLATKLKESEQGYKLSQKALRSKDIVDHKAVKFADRIQKEMTVKRSEIDQLLSKIHRLEENLETVTKEKTSLEKDKDNLKKGLTKLLLHIHELSDELQKSDSKKRELELQVTKLEEQLEQAALKASAASVMVEKCEQEVETLQLKHQLDLKEAERLARSKSGNIGSCTTTTGSFILSSDSASQNQNINSIDRKSEKTKSRDYSEVGRELTSLMMDMRNLISRPEESTHDTVSFSSDNEQREVRIDEMKKTEDISSCLLPALNVQDLRSERKSGSKEYQIDADLSKSWATRSLIGLDLSNFSSYKEWRPRSTSLTRNRQPLLGDLEKSFSASFSSKGGYSDTTRFSHTLTSPLKSKNRTNSVTNLLPDTQELCRRLEEKIDSLTRMGGNLVKENKEMAELINLQGKKLGAVRQNEKQAWEQR